MSRKLTPWFPGDVKPVREGVYERMYDEDSSREVLLCNFKNGEWYAFGNKTPEDALRSKITSSFQNLKWRGLTKEAK